MPGPPILTTNPSHANGPRKRAAEPLHIGHLIDEAAEGGASPELPVVRIAAARFDVEILAACGIGEAEPGLVWNAEYQVPSRDSCELGQRPRRLVEMFQDFEASNCVERIVFPGNFVDTRQPAIDPGISILRQRY